MQKNYLSILFVAFLVIGFRDTLYSQINPGNTNSLSPPPSFQPDSLRSQQNENLPDSTFFNLITVPDLTDKQIYQDTILERFHIYDPARSQDNFGVNLGNLGSSSRDLLFDVPYEFGTRYGFNQFDKYRLTENQFKYFSLNRPFSHLFWSPGGNQQSFLVKAMFSRNFSQDVNFTLDYQRVTQDGDYLSQRTRSTYLGTGFWKNNKKHDLLVLGIINANNEVHNGGISDLSLFEEPFYNFRERIPTNLTNAETRMANVRISVTNLFHFKDTLTAGTNFSLMHEIDWDKGSYKYFDESIGQNEITFYGDLLLDDRGVRTQLKYSEISQKAYFIRKGSRFGMRIGLVHSYFSLNNEVEQWGIHNLYLHGNTHLDWNQTMELTTEGRFGWVDKSVEFDVSGKLDITFSPGIRLSGIIRLYDKSPAIIQEKAQISQQIAWNQDFKHTTGSELGAILNLPDWNLAINLNYFYQLNPIYFNEEFRPVQPESSFSAYQFTLDSEEKLWWFHFRNRVSYQTFSENLYNLPDLLSEHDIFLEGKIFRHKMLTRLGVNVRFLGSHSPPGFFPVFGVFTRQDEFQTNATALMDVYTSFKIYNFRAFIRLENLNHLLTKDVIFYVKDYPQFDYRIRMGVSWLLKD